MGRIYSNYLRKRKKIIKRLVDRLSIDFEYVSVLGVDSTGQQYNVSKSSVSIQDTFWVERGFVLRVHNGMNYSEYSFNDISNKDFDTLVNDILKEVKIPKNVINNDFIDVSKYSVIDEQRIKESFLRGVKTDFDSSRVVEKLSEIVNNSFEYSDLLLNYNAVFEYVNISKIFISTKKDLEQSYGYGVGQVMALVRKESNTQYYYDSISGVVPTKVLSKMASLSNKVIDYAIRLLDAKTVIPGKYDVICAPDITGLIAHEAFGHGVEMDMFVKERAKAQEYINKEVASSLVSMRDGAKSALEVASYFFDDEGFLANDTLIIENGVLKRGISDILSATKLNSTPTGNGRRESFKNKAYTRMTNTFFEPGNDSLDDMIASVENGYLLRGTMSGMEDPKNWGIQCVAILGEEIKEGKLTGNIISPVLMTGYVPDLLKSISMVSKDFETFGSGVCGKGYKEFVKVSDGGPYIKAKVRLG